MRSVGHFSTQDCWLISVFLSLRKFRQYQQKLCLSDSETLANVVTVKYHFRMRRLLA